jgi:hypothetical protein
VDSQIKTHESVYTYKTEKNSTDMKLEKELGKERDIAFQLLRIFFNIHHATVVEAAL